MSVFVPAGDCPFPLVSTDTGIWGGLFLPQSESGGESGPPAGCRRLGNRCEPSRGCRARGGAVVGEDERGNSAGPVGSGVWAELCLPLYVSVCVQGGGG